MFVSDPGRKVGSAWGRGHRPRELPRKVLCWGAWAGQPLLRKKECLKHPRRHGECCQEPGAQAWGRGSAGTLGWHREATDSTRLPGWDSAGDPTVKACAPRPGSRVSPGDPSHNHHL